MANWPFAGDWSGLRVDQLREVFVALCCAVNEREKALAIDHAVVYTEWWLDQDGTHKKTFPIAEDFNGFKIIGEDKAVSDGLLHNLVALNAAVYGFTTKYVTSPGSETLVDYSDVTDDWGLFTAYAPESWQDHRVWCRCRDALKKMRYRKHRFGGSYSSTHFRMGPANIRWPPWEEPPYDWGYAGINQWYHVEVSGLPASAWIFPMQGCGGQSLHEDIRYQTAKSYTFPFSVLDYDDIGDVVKILGYVRKTRGNSLFAMTVKSSEGGPYTVASGSGCSGWVSQEFSDWEGATTNKTWSISISSWLPGPGVGWPDRHPFGWGTYISSGGRTILDGGFGHTECEIEGLDLWIDQKSVLTDL